MSNAMEPIDRFCEARSGEIKPIENIGRVSIAGCVDIHYVLHADARAFLPLLLVDGQPALPPYSHGNAVEHAYYTLGGAAIVSESEREKHHGLIEVRDASRIIVPADSRPAFMYEFVGQVARDAYLFPQPIAYEDVDIFVAQARLAQAIALQSDSR